MANEDLYEGLKMFQGAIAQVGIQRAISRATEEAEQINQSELAEKEKRTQLRNAANKVTGALAGLGVPASTIEQVAAGVGPQKLPTFAEAVQEGVLLGDQERLGQAQQMQDIEQRPKIAEEERKFARDKELKQMEIDAMKMKQGASDQKEENKLLRSYQKDFITQGKSIRESAAAARGALQVIKSGGPLTPAAIGPFMARASGERGNLTEQEKNVFRGRGDLISRVQRAISTGTLSSLPKGDRDAIGQLAQTYLDNADNAEQELGETLAGQAGTVLDKAPEELLPKVTGNKRKTFRTQQPGNEPPPKKNLSKYLK